MFKSIQNLIKLSVFLLLTSISLGAMAQPAGQLYDPEPPADSAYVRVLVVNSDTLVDVVVNGKMRGSNLRAGDPSDYMILTAGKHSIALHAAGKPTATITYNLEVPRGRAMTLAVSSLKPDVMPTVFEDKANTNKLKSQISAYHLDSKAGALDVMTADGSTKVFTNLAPGATNSIQVNPITVVLTAAKAGGTAAEAVLPKTALAMTQGTTYSLFLMPDSQGRLIARTVQNKTERYTGK